MTYGFWALAHVRRWGTGVRGAFVTAASQGREEWSRTCPHPLASLHPALHQSRACRDIGAGQKKKKNLSRVVTRKHGLSGSGNPLATGGESVLGKLRCLFNLTLLL